MIEQFSNPHTSSVPPSDPGMVADVPVGHSLVFVLLQTPLQEVGTVGSSRVAGRGGVWKVQLLVQYLVHSDEGHLSEEHAVEEAAQGPDGAAERVVAGLHEELRRHEDVRPPLLVDRSVRFDEGGHPEVDELDVVGGPVDEDVVRLDVPVDDVLSEAVREGPVGLDEYLPGGQVGETGVELDEGGQVQVAGAVLHHHAPGLAVPHEAGGGDDVLVVQGHGEVDLERQVSGRGRHVLRDALVFDLLEGYDLVVGLGGSRKYLV
jgi:hypothetical protein